MVDPFCFVMHPWLAGIAGRNKLLIKEKDICKDVFLLCFHLVQGSRFKVEVAALPPILLGDARKWYLSHGLPGITTI